MSSQLVATWTRTMAGREIDVGGFVDALLGNLVCGRSIAGRLYGSTEVELSLAGDATRIVDAAAGAKFRTICARLAVVFGATSRDPPLLYGGRLGTRLHLDHTHVDAELDFKNLPNDAWFSICRVA